MQEDFEMKKGMKLSILAAMFSAAFFVGTCPVGAYTYNGGTTTVDKVTEDENEFIVTGGANIISNGGVNPQKVKKQNVETEIVLNNRQTEIIAFTEYYVGTGNVRTTFIRVCQVFCVNFSLNY